MKLEKLIGKASMGGALIGLALLSSPSPAQAISSWIWSFTGSTGQSASGTFTTADVTPEAGVTYTITGITGTYNRDSVAYEITGLSNHQGADNTFRWDGTLSSSLLVSGGGISFDTSSEAVNMYHDAFSGYGAANQTTTEFSGADDSITSSTLQPATPVPFESDALPVVGSALFMAGGLWWKKKRSQAKVADFVAKK